MKKTFIAIGCAAALVVAFFLGSLSVKETSVGEPAETGTAPTRAITGTSKLYGKITKLDDKRVEIRLVEWVEGPDNQEQTALETGKCTLEGIEKDECLPNPFFIRETEKTMSLPLSSKLTIQVLSPGPNGEIKQDEELNTIHREVSVATLAKMLDRADFAEFTPFILTTKNGTVSSVKEQYIP